MYSDPAHTKAMSAADREVVAAKHEAFRNEMTESGELVDGLAWPIRRRRECSGRATAPWRLDRSAHGIEGTADRLLGDDCADLDRALAVAERVVDFHVTAAEVRQVHDSVD